MSSSKVISSVRVKKINFQRHPPKKLLIFDVDGTLINSEPLRPYRKNWGTAARAGRTVIDQLAQDLPHFRRIDPLWIRECLEHTAHIAFVSNGPRDYVAYALQAAGYEVDADDIYGSADKPCGQTIPNVIQNYHADRSSAVCIGDSPVDILAAQRNGLYSIGFCGGEFPEEKLLKAVPSAVVKDEQALYLKRSNRNMAPTGVIHMYLNQEKQLLVIELCLEEQTSMLHRSIFLTIIRQGILFMVSGMSRQGICWISKT